MRETSWEAVEVFQGEKITLNKVVTAELEINVWISCVYLQKESMT